MQILAIKNLGTLRPIDQAGEDAFKKIKNGAIVSVEVKAPRNVGHHRKFFAMLNIVFQNQDYYKSPESLLGACKLATGHVEIVRSKRGEIAIPLSISFAKMDQAAFDEFYSRAIDWVVSDVIPGLSKQDLDTEVAEQLRQF